MAQVNLARARALISKKTRKAFREPMVNWTLREIDDEFDAFDFRPDLNFSPTTSGQRRSLVEQYFHGIDWSSQAEVARILRVFEAVLLRTQRDMSSTHGAEIAQREYDEMLLALSQDGFEYVENRIRPADGRRARVAALAAGDVVDGSYIRTQIARMEAAIDEDPALAIGTAKELIETCCKTILEERGLVLEGTPDVAGLTKATLRVLKLVPEGVPEQARGASAIKRLLSNLGTIGNNMAELRSLYGTGHGSHARTKGLAPRHARLAVGAAATLVTFLFETHRDLTE